MKNFSCLKAGQQLAKKIKKEYGVEISETLLGYALHDAYAAGMDKMQEITRKIDKEMRELRK